MRISYKRSKLSTALQNRLTAIENNIDSVRPFGLRMAWRIHVNEIWAYFNLGIPSYKDLLAIEPEIAIIETKIQIYKLEL